MVELSLLASQDLGLIALQTSETRCSWCAFMAPMSHEPLLKDYEPLVTSGLLVEAAVLEE